MCAVSASRSRLRIVRYTLPQSVWCTTRNFPVYQHRFAGGGVRGAVSRVTRAIPSRGACCRLWPLPHGIPRRLDAPVDRIVSMGVSVTRKVLAVFLVLLPFVDTTVHTDAEMLRGGT